MKNSPAYSLGSNIKYSLRTHWSAKKSTLIFCALDTVMSVILPFVRILLPKLVIDELTAGATPAHFLAVVGGAAALLIALGYVKGYTDVIATHSVGTISVLRSATAAGVKRMTADYEVLEDPASKAIEDKALRASESNHTPANNIPRTLTRLASNLLGFALYGTVIAAIHPLILVLLIASAAISWLSLSSARKYENETREERSVLQKKLRYIQESTKTPERAKDVRLYSMSQWMKDLFSHVAHSREAAEGTVATRHMVAGLVDAALILVRDGSAYAYLTYLLLQGRIGLGDFVLIFSAIGAFAGWVSGIILESSELLRASAEQGDIRAFLDIPSKCNLGPGAPLPTGNMLPPAISLRNVSYTYPKADAPALKDINIDIKPGERIAIVGANGAGKTTLVKLICGLYRPQTGSISLAGIDISEYNRDEYFTLFSTVFQDIHLLSTDIAGNVSQAVPEATDLERVFACLKLAGLYEKVQTMPLAEKTMLVRQINDDAVELSGGELQKLALARALYKDAPVIVLDEPTAALDPIAESEIYRKYAELTRGRTSIYISHRLASTRFCDRILFLDNHTVEETGTHDELMDLGGKYARMFDVQSQYYKRDGEEGQE
ncbi:MAG: ABC transporter ATP-binding protein [Bacillota bacterium]|jgi:ATP-binding cassette subfamily B protein